MDVYRSLKMTADPDIIKRNLTKLQDLALKAEIEISYANLENGEGISNYEALLYMPKGLVLPLRDVVLTEFREVDYAIYSFITSITRNDYLDLLEKRISNLSGENIRISMPRTERDDTLFPPYGVEPHILRGTLEGRIKKVIFLRDVIKRNPYGVHIVEEKLVTDKAA